MNSKYMRKLGSLITIFALIIGQAMPGNVYAQSVANLPVPGTMISTSPNYIPPIITGVTIHPDNPLKFDFIIGRGDDNLQGEAFQKESIKLIKYFMTSLTVPDNEMWVNLSPYEKDRIVAEGLGNTEMGRDMLAQDYLLKQLTASLMYPEENIGSEFWDKVYKKAQEQFGTTEIPVNTFNKIWIVPETAEVYVNGRSVFVVKNHLKVMLEQDYLALEANKDSTKHGIGDVAKEDLDIMTGVSEEMVRELLIPEIEKEVNKGKTFANLRQIYNSMILATWYKRNLKENVFGQLYIDKNKIEGVDVEDKDVKNKIYRQYVEAFEKGVFNFIREDYDSMTQEIIPRKYFSGGLEKVKNVVRGQPSQDWIKNKNRIDHAVVSSDMAMIGKDDNFDETLPGATINAGKEWETTMTNPLFHDAKEFRYLVHAVLERPAQTHKLDDGRIWNSMGVMREPEKISEQFVISTSLIDSTHTQTFGWAGFILKVPAENILKAGSTDVGSDITGGKEYVEKLYSERSVYSPDEILSGTGMSFGKYNEVVITGTGRTGKRVEISAVFIKGKKNELTGNFEPRFPDFAEKFRALAMNMNIPIIEIENFDIPVPDKAEIIYMAPPKITPLLLLDNEGSIDTEGDDNDSAVLGSSEAIPGGIDFNPNNLNLTTGGDILHFDFPKLTPEQIQQINLNGFFPVIINIAPVTNFMMLLGESEIEDEQPVILSLK